ncbi:MAG: anaerobic glycerol-3-phosphate dehydrogenase subunit A [Desulfobacterales bacterium]|jgi:glycerol-3-phosphate dehydrogenase|nr:anaerobic glycerol-3-phosphate dehydrogenase subunit A [Desulfobacterales bacterium]
MPPPIHTQVLIIGGGITGVGLARDLALRGVPCVLVERRDICAGASGANHGLLHSGARYVRSDPAAAVECREENALLKQLAPHCVEETGGLFVAVEGDDERYAAEFPAHCERSGIACRELNVAEARALEPVLTENLIAAYQVEDASIDPFHLALDNLSEAIELGCRVMLHTRVAGLDVEDRRIRSVRLIEEPSGAEIAVEADLVVNASGAWARETAALAGIDLRLSYSKGSLLITDQRLTRRVINRLRPASDADILVPGGTVSILGTTSLRLDRLDRIVPTVEESDYIVDTAKAMIPALATTRYIRAYAGVRPLAGAPESAHDRSVSRGFELRDHGPDGVGNFVSIIGGKLTTYRLMAEKTADLVCEHVGVDRPCLTRTRPLKAFAANRWTAAGLSPRLWMEARRIDDLLLCECEMVPASAVDAVIEGIRTQGGRPSLYGIGRRSRIGKGTCQGAFCGLRINAYLYEGGRLAGREGLADLRAFLSARWRGMRPILWDTALLQEELQEALHCGYLGLELEEGL